MFSLGWIDASSAPIILLIANLVITLPLFLIFFTGWSIHKYLRARKDRNAADQERYRSRLIKLGWIILGFILLMKVTGLRGPLF